MKGALADIQELQLQSVKRSLGMLVEQPHALGRVDGGAAAQRDNHVRLKRTHFFHAAP